MQTKMKSFTVQSTDKVLLRHNPCLLIRRLGDTTTCLVNAMLHNRLTTLELQNELVFFFVMLQTVFFHLLYFSHSGGQKCRRLDGSYCTMTSAPMFVSQLKYHTQLLPLPNINYWDGASGTSWCKTSDFLYAIAKQNRLLASNSSFFYLPSSVLTRSWARRGNVKNVTVIMKWIWFWTGYNTPLHFSSCCCWIFYRNDPLLWALTDMVMHLGVKERKIKSQIFMD